MNINIFTQYCNCSDRHLFRSDWRVVTRLYRGSMLCIIMVFLLGLNVRGWGAAGVNHKLIFELDPRNHSSHRDILGTSLLLAVLWAISLVIFIFADYLSIPAFYSPLLLMVTYALFLFNPFRVAKVGFLFLTLHDSQYLMLHILNNLRGFISFSMVHGIGYSTLWPGCCLPHFHLLSLLISG